jgi:hypothetical protein
MKERDFFSRRWKKLIDALYSSAFSIVENFVAS